jgi:hypothetical protein
MVLEETQEEQKPVTSPRKESPLQPRRSAKAKRQSNLEGKSPSVPRNVPMREWEPPEKPDNWPSWGKVWTREHFEKEDMWNKEWETGGKHAPRRCRDNVARGSSPPPKAKEESSSLDNLSPRHDRDDDPFDDPPKAKYRSVGVITSGGGANYKPKRSRKKLAPESPKPLRSDSESDSDSSESEFPFPSL